MKYRYVLRNKHTNALHFRYYSLESIEIEGLKGLFDLENYEIVSRDRISGLIDKNGNEIYEGDICQTWFGNLKTEIVHIVNRHGAFWHKHPIKESYNNLHTTCKPYKSEVFQSNYYEIIGNIHEK